MSFCTAVNCLDGRVQIPVFRFLCERFHVRYVDMITEAGPVGVLAKGESEAARSIFRRVQASLDAHQCVEIAVAAHHGCIGNPLPDHVQRKQLEDAVELLKKRYRRCEIIGLWVHDDRVSEI